MVNKKKILWNLEDELEHFPIAKEWWSVLGFFNTIENNQKWSFKIDLAQYYKKNYFTSSTYSLTVFNINTHKIFNYFLINESSKLQSLKNEFYIKFNKSLIRGRFPNYQISANDPKNNIKLDIEYRAKSSPYWVAQQATNGWLPWGFGFFRYGFIPNNEIDGTIIVNDYKYHLKGKGYFEHIWGNFSYSNIFKISNIKRTISTYARLIGRWIHHQDFKIPKSIMFSSDNRSPGYDWVWAVLDNGWSLFYGNMMFWISEGPATGTLIFTKDGVNYKEFNNIFFKYNKMKYLSKYDFFYPIEQEITAKRGNEKLYLHITNISESIEFIQEEPTEKILLGFVICQVPTKIEGYYYDGAKKTKISGLSKMEFHRLLKVYGHNSLKLNFSCSNNCFGIKSNFNSHYLGKKLYIDLQILPKPAFIIRFERIDKPILKNNNSKLTQT